MSYLSDLLPSVRDYANVKKVWRHDVIAGITVGIVALPLALAFGITTGAGAPMTLDVSAKPGFFTKMRTITWTSV